MGLLVPFVLFIGRTTPHHTTGGSQGDIYQIRKTVEELNAIYQVWVAQRQGRRKEAGCVHNLCAS